jgi:hypothetical protein
MAEEITNAPLPTAEQITELVNSGQIAPETASLFAPAPVEPIMSEEIVPEPALEPVLEPTLEEQVQNTDFDQYDTTALQDEIIQEAAQPQDQLTQDVLASDIQDQPVDETVQNDAAEIAIQTEVKKASIMEQLSDLKAAEESESLQRQKLIDEQEAIFSDVEDLKQTAKDTEVDDFWSSSSTGTKIMAALAIGLGAAAGVQRGDNQNQALQLINGIVNQQMKAKQQSFKNQLAVKSAVMDKVQAQLRVLDSKTASRQKSANIAVMMQGIQAEKGKLDIQLKEQVQKSMFNQKLRSGKTTLEEEQVIYDSLPKQQREQANVLRKEYNQQIKDSGIEEIIPKVQDLENFKDSPSAAGDIALIFAYMKTLDPNSVVRESEFKVAAEAGSATQRAAALANKILTGERVSESIRKDFFNRAKDMVKNKLNSAKNVSERATQLAISQGIPPKAGLGIKDYSFESVLPREAAYDFAERKLGKSREQIDKVLEANQYDIYTMLEKMKR